MNVVGQAASLLCLLPSSRLKNALLSRLPGWQVHPTAYIAPVLVRNVAALHMGEHSRIALGTVIRNMRSVTLGDHARIGRSNWISSNPDLVRYSTDERSGRLEMALHSAVTSRHHIDCSGGFSVGRMSVLAGHGSTVLSHGVDFVRVVQAASPVEIGEACFIGTSSILTAGARIGDHIVLGAGSVVVNDLDRPDSLYAGVPATYKKSLEGIKFFRRTRGFIWPAGHPNLEIVEDGPDDVAGPAGLDA